MNFFTELKNVLGFKQAKVQDVPQTYNTKDLEFEASWEYEQENESKKTLDSNCSFCGGTGYVDMGNGESLLAECWEC